MAKKKYKKPIMVPEAEERMQQLRHEIVKQNGWLVINADDWWEVLTPMQKAQVNGLITKMMVAKAKQDLNEGLFYGKGES